jgi:hypothetical protein
MKIERADILQDIMHQTGIFRIACRLKPEGSHQRSEVAVTAQYLPAKPYQPRQQRTQKTP